MKNERERTTHTVIVGGGFGRTDHRGLAAGGTLGIEDAGVLRAELADESDTAENANGAAGSAERYAAFSHRMITTEPAT